MTTTLDTPSRPQTASSRLFQHVNRSVARLQTGYLLDRAWAVSELARIRHGVGKPLGSSVELIGLTTAQLEPESPTLPDAPTALELAAYTAITFYAMHQQSQRKAPMHVPTVSLGTAAWRLSTSGGSEEAVQRRFEALGTASTWEEATYHSRGIIQQLRSEAIPLDYALFATDLFLLHQPEYASRVRNRWGRDFYRTRKEVDGASTPPPNDDAATDSDTTDITTADITKTPGEPS
ncbi:hypothetical protein GCM10022198_15640 [Klugiella xanthotipulae]|uniref:CRISPR-associated Cse2 family protein n=1 Tax=Klugiella xanthotipulae TaxID=244735 RepID=A0A543HH01_9MICO|nr:type I-E CRISPR-associated protein Cse2/CasB [Klugiella xanthotipulae]TQM57600.1 CRISPR-associated Cse2 family protein [Klugiella xanthotipulae]